MFTWFHPYVKQCNNNDAHIITTLSISKKKKKPLSLKA